MTPVLLEPYIYTSVSKKFNLFSAGMVDPRTKRE